MIAVAIAVAVIAILIVVVVRTVVVMLFATCRSAVHVGKKPRRTSLSAALATAKHTGSVRVLHSRQLELNPGFVSSV